MEVADAGPGAFKHGCAYRLAMLGRATRGVAATLYKLARGLNVSRRGAMMVRLKASGWVPIRRCPCTEGGSPSAGLPAPPLVCWCGGLARQARQCWALGAALAIPACPHVWWVSATITPSGTVRKAG